MDWDPLELAGGRRAWVSGGLEGAEEGGVNLPRTAGLAEPRMATLVSRERRAWVIRGTDKQEQNKRLSKTKKQNKSKERHLLFRSGLLSQCTQGRIEEHADEDVTQITVFNIYKQGRAGQYKVDTNRNTGE